ncbi:hypothetical protein Q8X48_25015 [Pseudomonas sp. QLc11A]|uniref:Uncharacterized protein n=1 Tax=Pseudomonas azerbaijanorientalis TaxID=2842350 RepID=A0ABW8W4T0_9PSED
MAVTHFPRKNLPAQLHVGIVYQGRGKGKLNLLHLAAHYDLRCAPIKNRYKCVPSDYFDSDELDFFAETAARVWEKNEHEGIPYGFRYTGASEFNGDLSFANKAGAGLTCATFIMAFFSSRGYDIIDVSGWKNRTDDTEWQKWVYEEIEHLLSEEEATSMRDSIGQAFRYRPEEVVGSYAGFEGVPLGFSDAVVMGENFLLDYGPR